MGVCSSSQYFFFHPWENNLKNLSVSSFGVIKHSEWKRIPGTFRLRKKFINLLIEETVPIFFYCHFHYHVVRVYYYRPCVLFLGFFLMLLDKWIMNGFLSMQTCTIVSLLIYLNEWRILQHLWLCFHMKMQKYVDGVMSLQRVLYV